MELYSTILYLKKREKEWLVNLSPLTIAFRPVISHLGINGVRAQPNGPIERNGGELLHNWKENEKLPVIFENEYFIHKDEDNFLGV